MDPNQTPGTEQIDPTALALSRAIRRVESGGHYNAIGDSGESKGAYQYNKNNYEIWAREFGLDPNDFSVRNQDQVAYKKIKQMLDAGRSQSEVAAMWNGAHQEKGKMVANKPDYVANVQREYEAEMGRMNGLGSFGQQQQNPFGAQNQMMPQQQPQNPFAVSRFTPETDNRDFLQKLGEGAGMWPGVNNIFPGEQIGKELGTYAGLGMEKIKGALGGQDNSATYDMSTPTTAQLFGDTAQTALFSALSAPGGIIPAPATALGRIGQSTAVGGGFGLTSGLKEGKTGFGELAKDTAVGGAVGGAIGAGAEALKWASKTLPTRIAKSYIPKINDTTAEYAVNRGLGKPEVMKSESDAALKGLETSLDGVLKNPAYANTRITGDDVLWDVAERFPNKDLNGDILQREITKNAPNSDKLVNKLFDEGLTLPEARTLNSDLGRIYKADKFNVTTTKAGKDIANAARQAIKQAVVQVAPESASIFSDYSKEIQLNDGLKLLIEKGHSGKLVGLTDIMAAILGYMNSGLKGVGGALAAEKLIRSPTANLRFGNALSNLNNPTAQTLGKGILPYVLKQAGNLAPSL